MASDLKSASHNLIVIDGIRRMADIIYLREVLGFKLIKIVANEKLRYERVVKRNENPGDGEKTFDQFLKEEKAETEAEIPEVMSHADYEIVNEGSFVDLEETIDNIMEQIKANHGYARNPE